MTLEQWFSQRNPDGSRRLRKDAAKFCGLSAQMISEYIRHQSWPSRETMILLREWTNGEWTPNDELPPYVPREARSGSTDKTVGVQS